VFCLAADFGAHLSSPDAAAAPIAMREVVRWRLNHDLSRKSLGFNLSVALMRGMTRDDLAQIG
jgi:hypothetical protein